MTHGPFGLDSWLFTLSVLFLIVVLWRWENRDD